MAKRLTVFLLAIAGVLAPVADAAAAGPARAKLRDCDVKARSATFEGSMRTVRRASRLEMRFMLQTRSAEQPVWAVVEAPRFARWLRSSPGKARFVYEKTVERLAAPGDYRVVVRFRWRDAAGDVIRRTHRRSPGCRQPDARPDLVPLRVRMLPGPSSATRTYVVVVANAGLLTAPSTTVGLLVDGDALPVADLRSLAAGGHGSARFVGPACRPGDVLQATVDPDGLVDEADEAGNALSVPCPAK